MVQCELCSHIKSTFVRYVTIVKMWNLTFTCVFCCYINHLDLLTVQNSKYCMTIGKKTTYQWMFIVLFTLLTVIYTVDTYLMAQLLYCLFFSQSNDTDTDPAMDDQCWEGGAEGICFVLWLTGVFTSYDIFNLQYQQEAECTPELIQKWELPYIHYTTQLDLIGSIHTNSTSEL